MKRLKSLLLMKGSGVFAAPREPFSLSVVLSATNTHGCYDLSLLDIVCSAQYLIESFPRVESKMQESESIEVLSNSVRYSEVISEITDAGQRVRKFTPFHSDRTNEKGSADTVMMMSLECYRIFSTLVNADVSRSRFKFSDNAVAYALAMICIDGYAKPEHFDGETVISMFRLWEIVISGLSKLRMMNHLTISHMEQMVKQRTAGGYSRFLSSYNVAENMRKSNSDQSEMELNRRSKAAILGEPLFVSECVKTGWVFSLCVDSVDSSKDCTKVTLDLRSSKGA